VCSCSVCGRKRAVIDKEIERLFNEYCSELEYRGTKQEERQKLQQKLQFEKFRLKILQQQQKQTNGKEVLEKKDGEPEIEVSKDDFISWNFGKNLIIKNGLITMREEWLEQNSENILEVLQTLEFIERQDAFVMYPTSHHKNNEMGDECEAEPEDEEEEDEEFAEEQRWRESRRMFRLYTAKLLFKAIIMAYKEKISLEMQRALIDEEEKEKQKKKKKKKKEKPKKLDQESKEEKEVKEEPKVEESKVEEVKEEPKVEESKVEEEEEEPKEEENEEPDEVVVEPLEKLVEQIIEPEEELEEIEIARSERKEFQREISRVVGFEKKKFETSTPFLGREINWLK